MREQVLMEQSRRYLAALYKRRGLVLSCAGTSLIVVVLYNYTTRPVYQATTQILIDKDTPDVLPTKELVDMAQGGGNDYFQTQYQLLHGRALAQKVVERLQLQNNAELQSGSLISPWERFQRSVLGKAPAATLDTDGMPLSPAVAAFRSRLSVEPVPGSRLVNLRFTAYNPTLAAQAVNTLAQLYIEQSLEFRYTTSSEATGWLSERLKEQKRKVATAEKALQDYRERQGLVNFEERQGLVDQKLSALTASLMSARAERIQKETLHGQLRNLSEPQLETYPLVMASSHIQTLKSQLADLQREQARLSENLGDKHPDMVKVRSQIKSTEGELRSEIQKIVRSAESDYRTARQQEANLESSLESTKREALDFSRMGIDYSVLKREVDSNQQLYQELLNRTKETGLEKELQSTNIRIVEKAEAPRAPISPKKMQNIRVALMLGLALGIGLVLFFEHLDTPLRSAEDVKQVLGLPFLGMIPEVAVEPRPVRALQPTALVARGTSSAVAESYRVIRTNLIFSSPEATGRLLIVSSANPSEGKTTTVANLASSLALNGARVLAVDADLRRPMLHQYFGASKAPGLSDLIVGKCQPSYAIVDTRFKGLQFLPCGHPSPNPTELLGSPRMREVLNALRTQYDWVLIDAPPVLPVADAMVLSPLVDGIVLVVGSETSGRSAIDRAIGQIRSVGGKVTGVILNKVDVKQHSYYYGNYYKNYAASTENAPLARAAGPRPVRRS